MDKPECVKVATAQEESARDDSPNESCHHEHKVRKPFSLLECRLPRSCRLKCYSSRLTRFKTTKVNIYCKKEGHNEIHWFLTGCNLCLDSVGLG